MQWRMFSPGYHFATDLVFVRIAMAKDDTAIVFGEDVAFGGVFRCTMVSPPVLFRYHHLICLCRA